jgi:hypothetical protein
VQLTKTFSEGFFILSLLYLLFLFSMTRNRIIALSGLAALLVISFFVFLISYKDSPPNVEPIDIQVPESAVENTITIAFKLGTTEEQKQEYIKQ